MDKIPTNAIIEKERKEEGVIRRTDINQGMDLKEQMEIWKKETATEVDTEEILKRMEKYNIEGIKTAGIGSLEKIKNIKIENIAAHKNTEIEIPGGIAAVCGRNGAGKTFLMESPFAAWFGVLFIDYL